MRQWPRSGPISSTSSIDGGRPGGLPALWWRDDDAATPTPQLSDLLRLAGEVPLALAVIPALAQPELATALRGSAASRGSAAWLAACQPGQSTARKANIPKGGRPRWSRRRSAPGGPASRPCSGRAPCPCWCRRGTASPANFCRCCRRTGSPACRRWPRRAARPCRPALCPGSSHRCPCRSRRMAGRIAGLSARPRRLVGLVGHLRATRLGAADSAGPIGILTHHLIMDDATAAFLDRLIALIGTHAACPLGQQLPRSCNDAGRGG